MFSEFEPPVSESHPGLFSLSFRVHFFVDEDSLQLISWNLFRKLLSVALAGSPFLVLYLL